MGTITGISDLDPVRWPNSHWRSVKVTGCALYDLAQYKQACLCYYFVNILQGIVCMGYFLILCDGSQSLPLCFIFCILMLHFNERSSVWK